MNTLSNTPELSPMQLIDMGDLNNLPPLETPHIQITESTAKRAEAVMQNQECHDRTNQA